MKDKLIDKKIVILLLIMLSMIIFMIIFLSKQNKNLQEELNMQTGDIVSMINKKQKDINNFLNDEKGLFSEGLLGIFRRLDLVSYIKLPLEVNSQYNNYPFGGENFLE